MPRNEWRYFAGTPSSRQCRGMRIGQGYGHRGNNNISEYVSGTGGGIASIQLYLEDLVQTFIMKSIVARVAEPQGDNDLEKDIKVAIDDLLTKGADSPNNFQFTIKIVPSCDDVDKTEGESFDPPPMAMVYFTSAKGGLPEFLQDCKDGWITVPWIFRRTFHFDSSFIGFTQLYPTKSGKIAADIVALTGLNAHAFGSWRGASGSMWLQDFLPQHKSFPSCRTMIYGYNAKFDTPGTHTILDYAYDLMDSLGRVRLTKEVWRFYTFHI